MTPNSEISSSTSRLARPAWLARHRRVAARAAAVGVPVVALIAAILLTRDSAATEPAAGGHNHAAMTAGGDSARPVQLTDEQARRIGVTFARVESTNVPRQVRTVGQVTYDETQVTTVSPKIDGWVERLYVDFTGRSVQRGEPLFTVYSPMLVTAQEELLLAHRLAHDVAGASADAREGATDLIASARRRLAYWDIPAQDVARIERAGQVQRAMTLRAPATGVVLEKAVTQGQRIMAGEVLYRIADLRTIWVEGDVYEQDLGAMRVGQPATAEFDAWPGQRWSGRITFISPTVSPDTRTARVRVELSNPEHRLKPGMLATLYITGAPRPATLTVPRGAVLVTGERQIVFVRRPDDRLEPRLVQVGATSGDRTEILRGLRAGELVVASATFLIDAESNLGTALGGMGDMPGMEFTLPPTSGDATPSSPAPAPSGATSSPGAGSPAGDPHAAHRAPPTADPHAAHRATPPAPPAHNH